jgi:hypothetical protein
MRAYSLILLVLDYYYLYYVQTPPMQPFQIGMARRDRIAATSPITSPHATFAQLRL